MPKLNWDGNNFRNNQDSSGTVSDNISRNGNLQQGYNHGSLTRGLVAYYPMEKGQGEILHDGALNNTGQIKGGSSGTNTEPSDLWVNPVLGGNAINFDGEDDYISTENAFLDGLLSSADSTITVSMWIKTTMSSRGDIFNTSDGSTPFLSVQNSNKGNSGSIDWGIRDDNGNSIQTYTNGGIVDDNAWHHITCVKRGSTSSDFEIWIDGSSRNLNYANSQNHQTQTSLISS